MASPKDQEFYRTIGQTLRSAREQAGYSLEDAAANVRIKLEYLGALEQGNIARLPAEVYALGYARLYAKWLNLDIEALLAQVVPGNKSGTAAPRLREHDIFVPPSDKLPVDKRGWKMAAAVAAGLAFAAVLSYGVWNMTRADKDVETAERPERLAPSFETAGLRVYEKPTAPTAAAAPEPAPTFTEQLQRNEPAVGTYFPAEKYADAQLVLMAHEDTWVRVLDAQNKLIARSILKAGDTFFVPRMEGGVFIAAGNTKAVEVIVDGDNEEFLGTLHEIAAKNTLSSGAMVVSQYQ